MTLSSQLEVSVWRLPFKVQAS